MPRPQDAGENRIPPIARARGYRLYGTDGTRYVDFYQEGGRALLGHRPEDWTRLIKSTGNRGLLAAYPSRFEGTAVKMARSLFPWARGARLYRSIGEALAAVSAERGGIESRLADPLLASEKELRDQATVILWRPRALTGEQQSRMSAGAWGRWVIPLLPVPGDMGAALLLEVADGPESGFETVPEPGAAGAPGDTDWAAGASEPILRRSRPQVPPLAERLAVRAMNGLSRYEGEAEPEPWRLFDLPGTVRRGPYLMLGGTAGVLDGGGRSGYTGLFRGMLERGVLLPPDSAEPAIIPAECTEGEVMPLVEELKRRYADR